MLFRSDKMCTKFIVDRLDYMYKGGRCSGFTLLGANLFSIKPSIQISDGRMVPSRKFRGAFEKAIFDFIDAVFASVDDIDDKRLFISHARCNEDLVKAVVEHINKYIKFEQVFVSYTGAVVSSHCGPNTLGIEYRFK